MVSVTSAREGASGEGQAAHVLGASGEPVGCRWCAFRVQAVRISGALCARKCYDKCSAIWVRVQGAGARCRLLGACCRPGAGAGAGVQSIWYTLHPCLHPQPAPYNRTLHLDAKASNRPLLLKLDKSLR